MTAVAGSMRTLDGFDCLADLMTARILCCLAVDHGPLLASTSLVGIQKPSLASVLSMVALLSPPVVESGTVVC